MNRFKNLNIWKRAVGLATEIYKLTRTFPAQERYGLISQLRRCVISISSNIAEGAGRGTNKAFRHFLNISYGSSCELETQLMISKNLGFIKDEDFKKVLKEINEVQKMIYSFSKTLE